MILSEVRDYLRAHKRATLGDLALHFDVPHEAMRGMVEQFVGKGRVRPLTFEATCNTACPTACDDTAMTIYEWVGHDGSGAPVPPRRVPTASSTFRSLQTVSGSVGGGCCRSAG